MKTFLVLLALVCMQQTAFAEGVTELKKDDLSISQADAKIVSVREICPPAPGGIRCMAVGSVVSVKVTLGGCLDRFGGYFSRFEQINGKGYLFFSAINIFNKGSTVARCVRIPTHNVTIHVPYEGQIELVELEYMGESRPQF